jgi:hypothetical protein
MNLESAANEAMTYLDIVGVAAEWEILSVSNALSITTDDLIFAYYSTESLNSMISELKYHYPQKSPS